MDLCIVMQEKNPYFLNCCVLSGWEVMINSQWKQQQEPGYIMIVTFSTTFVLAEGGAKIVISTASLVPRPFPPPVFDRLQYANTEGEGLGGLVTCGYVR